MGAILVGSGDEGMALILKRLRRASLDQILKPCYKPAKSMHIVETLGSQLAGF